MLTITRPPWRDGMWIQPDLPTPFQFRKLTFGERLRAIPVSTRLNHFRYLSWVLTLIFIYLARLLVSFYMTTATFGATSGVGVELAPFRLTREDVAAFCRREFM